MQLVEIIEQHRRDFKGRYVCEFCGEEYIDNGLSSYDDRNYHDNVIPSIVCKHCGKSTISGGGEVKYTETKYPAWQQI